jgi:serine protease Do
MKQTIFALALVVCVAGFVAGIAIAQEKKEHTSVYTMSGHQKGGWLGVAIQDISSKMAKKKGLKNQEGAYVSDVVDDSPADSAGIKEGDIVVEFNSKKIDDADDLLRAVQKTKPGTKTSIVILRDNDRKSFDIAVGKNRRTPPSMAFAPTPPFPPHMGMFSSSRRWGLELSELNEQLGEYFGAPNGRGLLVERVEKKSSGAKAGFKAGDVITKINKSTVEDFRDLSDAIEDVEEGAKVDVEVLRKGSAKTLTVEIEDEDEGPSSFNYRFEGMPEFMRNFRVAPIPAVDMDNLRIQIQKSRPNMDGLREQIEELREGMTKVTV